MLQGEGRFLLLGRMLVSESGDVPVAERKALGISQNERVFEATRAGAAIFLRHLVGQSATSNDLVGGCLGQQGRSGEHTSELQVTNAHLVCRRLLEKKKHEQQTTNIN